MVQFKASTIFLLSSATLTWAFAPQTATTFSAKKTKTESPSSSALFAKSGLMSVRCTGIGSAVPKTVVTNKELEDIVETDDEWIRQRTGIGQRRLLQHNEFFGKAPEGKYMVNIKPESLRLLQYEASVRALDMANVKAEDLDLIIVATSTAEDMFGDATTIASELGCTTKTVAFDLVAACSGFMFGAVTAGKYLSHGPKNQKALVIGADALSRWVDWDDRNTCILFGDGAGAMVIESCEDESESGILGFASRSNGKGYFELNCEYVGKARELAIEGRDVTVNQGGYGPLFMNGKEVYKFATREVPNIIQEVLEESDMTVDQIDWLLLHQANIRIIEVVAKRLGIPMEKVITN